MCARDLVAAYEAMMPEIPFAHAEGNSDAHLMSTLLGSSVTMPVDDGRLRLGTWQGIFFVELDGRGRGGSSSLSMLIPAAGYRITNLVAQLFGQ